MITYLNMCVCNRKCNLNKLFLFAAKQKIPQVLDFPFKRKQGQIFSCKQVHLKLQIISYYTYIINNFLYKSRLRKICAKRNTLVHLSTHLMRFFIRISCLRAFAAGKESL